MDDEASRTVPSLTDWSRLREELVTIAASSGAEFDQATVSNADKFLVLVRDNSPLPEIVKGSGSSFRFFWGLTLEFEVFGDRVEIYRFYDQRTDIQHHAHKPGEPFSAAIVRALPGRHG